MAQFPVDIVVTTPGAQQLNPLNRQLDQTDRAATGAAAAARALSAAIAAIGVGSVVTNAITVNSQFNKSISELSAITGATGRDLKFLTDASKEFGATTTLSASQAATAFKLIASAKPDLLSNVEALKAVTREAITLAEAAGIDLPAAANALGNSLNQFNAAADESGRFINVLAAGAKFGSSSIAETSEALKNAGVSAANAKVSFEATNAAIQALATAGLRGAEAGTGLRNVLTILDTSADKSLRPSLVGLSGALDQLAAKQLDNTEFVKLFGRENQNAARILLNQRENLAGLTAALTGTNIAYEQAATNVDNLNGDLTVLASAYEGVQIEAAALADGGLRDVTQALKAGLQGLNKNPERIADALETLGTVATATAAVFAGRLVTSVTAGTRVFVANTAASLAAKVQYDSLGLAIARTTVAANVGTVAVTGLTRALTFLGGPVGVVLLAATALTTFASSAREAADAAGEEELRGEIDVLIDRFKQLNDQGKQITFQKLTQEQIALSAALRQAQEDFERLSAAAINSGGSGGLGGASQAAAASQAAVRVRELEQALNDLNTKQLALFNSTLPEINQELKATATITEDVAAVNTGLTESYTKLASELALKIALTQQSTRESAITAEVSKLTAENSDAERQAIAQLAATYFDLSEARRKSDEAQLAIQQFDQSVESPIERLEREAEAVREANRLAAENAIGDKQEFADRDLAITAKLEADKLRLTQASQSAIRVATAQGLDALAGIVEAAGGKQTKAYRAIYAASRAFALADSIAKVTQASAQALADPTAVTLPQKFANYAAVATAGASLISALKPQQFADGGPVSGAGTGRSDSIPAYLSNGEYVMTAQRTAQYRSELDAMRRGTFNSTQPAGAPRVTIINNVSDTATATVTEGPDGELIATIDRRIAEQTPGIIEQQLADPYSGSTRQLNSAYRLEKR